MAGVSAITFAPLTGFDHVVQSIGVILTTRRGTRVMRRDFGSDVPGLLDRPLNTATMVDAMVAVAEALDAHEPRFQVQTVNVSGGAEGIARIDVAGLYYPRGHLGDRSRPEPRRAEVML